ncbi:MAG: asparagine synthase-related protein [Parvularculaceae bacterium]
MSARFFAIADQHGAIVDIERVKRQLPAALAEFRLILKSQRLAVFAAPDARITVLPDGAGVIIGELFHRNGNMQGAPLDRASAARIVESRGTGLIEDYWGEYVAFLALPEELILRDPSGAIPCYRSEVGETAYFYSDIEILLQRGILDPSISWDDLARTAAYPAARSSRTCIAGVRELMPGFGCEITAPSAPDFAFWSPWNFSRPEYQFKEREEAIDALRDAVEMACACWADLSNAPMLELSGGIDSSIVAVGLALAGVKPLCATLVSSFPGEDEREYAALAAERIGASWEILQLRPEDIDMMDVSSGRSCRPLDHPLKRIIDLAFARIGRERGVDAFFSGSGGDYVLGYLRSSAPAADALRSFGFGRRFLAAASDIARLHRASVWKVAHLAVRKAVLASAPVTQPAPAPFLSKSVRAMTPALHPWASPPKGVPPGKIEQISMLASGQGVREGRARGGLGPNRAPLLAQPVVEAGLRTPSWMAVEGGRNRAVARDAFASHLPEAIINRRTKTDFSGLISEIFELNRPVLCELLLDGALAREGIVDRSALEAYLRQTRPPEDISFTQALQLASIELWVQNWRRR